MVASVVFNVYQFCNTNNALYNRGLAYRIISSFDAALPWLFVITGFLVFEPIARAAIDRKPSGGMRSFLNRRIVRLVPLYYIAVIVVWFFRQQSLPGDWRDLLEHLTFTQVFDAKRIFYTDGPTWAVSVLMFFYLIIVATSPGLSRTCRGLASRRHRVVVVSTLPAGLAALSLLWKAWSLAEHHRPITGSSTTWYGPLANLDSFAVGMTVAILLVTLQPARRTTRSRGALMATAVAILIAAVSTRTDNDWFAVYFFTACSLAFGCLTAATVLNPRITYDRRPAARLLAGLGITAYGTYLWHEPILLALHGHGGVVTQSPDSLLKDSAAVLTLSIAAGWLSYLLIQRPANHLLRIFGASSPLVSEIVDDSTRPNIDDRAAPSNSGATNRLDYPTAARRLTVLSDTKRDALPDAAP